MRANEFNSQKFNDLDRYLVELCDYVLQGLKTNPKKYGMVGACVLDPKGNQTVGSSTHKNGKWVHAERVAIENYLNEYGKIPKGSIIVTTLSPCNEVDDETAEKRAGNSCTDLINQTGINEVYCGYSDPSQENNHNHYREVFTKNSKIKNLCKQFADTFLPNHLHEDDDNTAMMGKIESSGKIVRILRKQHSVPFSNEKDWLLIDTDPEKGNKGLGIKWIPAKTKFSWVKPYLEKIDELSFLGSPCTKDCSGHRAGYNWSKQRGNTPANSWSQSFNNGAALAQAGK